MMRNSNPERLSAADGLKFVFHPSFEARDAASMYGDPAPNDDDSASFLPDEVTREVAKRMHYSAWQASRAKSRREAAASRRRYHESRNRIVVGNHKLIFKAVQKWSTAGPTFDDLVGDCEIVLIKAVAAFNPWLGIRFSTYAFTCLMRALARMSRRRANDRLAHSVSLDTTPYAEPFATPGEDGADPRLAFLGKFFQPKSSLLTSREKLVISRRYHLKDAGRKVDTLERVGQDLGLSKERVRQVQKAALAKLRVALSEAAPAS